MATEANLEPISEKNLQVTEQNQTQQDSIPTDNSSSLHDTAKGDILHSTADSILDTSDSEILVEAPSNDQGSLTNPVAQNEKQNEIVNDQKLDTRIKEHIIEEDNVAMNVLERGASEVNVMATEKLLSTDETDNDQLEISTTEPENIIHETVDLGEVMESGSSKELKLADAISCNPTTMLSTVKESLQSDKMLTVDPISIYDSMSDAHLLSTSKNTVNNVTLNDEKPTFENSEATQDQHFEDGGVEVEGNMLEKMNSPRQNIDEVYDKGENLNDELQIVLIPITSTECTSHKDDCKDEKLEETFDLTTDNKNPVEVETKDDEINKGTSDASSSIQLIAEETEKLDVVSTEHDEGQSSEEVMDHDEDDTPLTSLSMPKMSKVDAEDDLEEAEALSGTQNEKIESVIEDKDVNMMDESTFSNAESNIRTEGVSMTEPSEKEKPQELPEVKIEEDSAPTEDGQECRIENPLLDAGQEEIAKPEKENTCKEELSMTVEENSEENGGKCEKIADSLANEYQDLGDKIVSPNYKAQESFGDLPFAQDRAEETIQERGEMRETAITSSNDDLKHDDGGNLDQKSQGPDTENLEKNSKLLSEDPNHRTVDAEATNIDTSGDALEVNAAVTDPFVSQATTVEDVEKAMEHGERTEEKFKSVDNNEDHDKHTCEAIVEVVAENRDHEYSRIVEDSNPEDEQNDENTGVIYMEQMEDENLCKGNELEQENDDLRLSEDSHISLEKSKTEETLDCALEKDKLEDETEYDPSPECEKFIKEKHIVFIGDIEKDQLEKQEQENYNAHDKHEIVKEKNEDLQETIGEKDEQDSNYACEKVVLETAYIQDKILVDSGGHGSENTEMVSESGPENKTIEQTDETEATRIDKSTFDDNFSNMNIATNDLCEETTTANEMSESSKANYFVDEETMQEKVHENSTDTVCEEKNHNMNDKDLIREEMETENSEKVSELVSEENNHNKISALEDVDIDTLAGGSDLATSQVQEESTQKSTDPEVANEHISSINNDDEGHNTNEGLTKVVAENDIQERTEEKRCMEDELTIGTSIDEEKIESEKLEKRNDLDEGKESVTVSDDVEICLDETTTENASGSSVEIVGSEDKLEKTSDVSEKNIKVEISSSSQDAEVMDLLEEQEESLKEKDAGMLLEDAVTVMVTDKASSILDAAHMEYINEVEDDKQKESLKYTSVEETYGTINHNSIERDPSQKIEFLSAPALEEKDPETNEEKETSKIENSIDDDNLKREISETIEPNDLIESAKDDPTETKDTGSNSNSYVLIEETVCCGIDEKHREVEITCEEQACQSTNLIRNTACEEKIDNKKLGISSGLLDDKDQDEIGESAIAKIDSSIDDINSKMINMIAELSEDIEIVQMKDEENFINAIKKSPDNHALVVPTPSEPIDEKYEEASKYELEEQCHQKNNAEDKTEAYIHKDTENLQILPEKMEIPEIVDQNDDPATAKVRSKNTLERSIRNTGVLVEKANNNGIGEEQENVCLITNSEDTVDVDVHKEKGNNTTLDIDSDMEPEEQGQVTISEKESVKVEQGQSLQSDAQCPIISEMTNDTAPGSSVEHNIKAAYEFGIDEQLETTSRSENINDEVHQDVQEEPLNKIHEKSVSTKNENLAEVYSEREMIACEAKDVNLVRIAYEETKELEEEIPATTFTGQNSERKVVDGIKRVTTTEEIEESRPTTVAQNSETLVEMKSDKTQLPGDASQTMEAKGQGDKTYTTIKEDDSNILDPIIVDKDEKNQDENTNEILDPLPITSALTDEAAYENLHSDQDGSTIKEDHSMNDIPNQEVDSELRSVGQNVEVMIETEPIKLDIPENDGVEGNELSMASEDKLERLEFERKEMTRMKEEALDACPSQVKEPTEDAEVEHISLQTVENERMTVTEAKVKVSDLMSQENLENGLSTTEASLEENMPESTSTVLPEGQSQKVPTHINIAEMTILEDETEEVQLQVQESLNDEEQNEKQEEKSEVEADQIESQMNTNDTNEKEGQSSKVDSHKAKLEEGELEKTLHEVPEEIETTETENIYKDRIEKQNLDEDIQMDGNELLKDSTTELEGGNNEPIHVSDATEDAIPQEEQEESKCKIVDDLPVVSHKLVEEPKKMETSDHQKMKNTEPEILEKGGETSEGTITQNNEILQTSEKSDADVQNDANEHVQQLEGLSSTISKNLERAETKEYIEKNSEAEEEAFRAQIIASLIEVTANEQFQGEENDSNKQNKPETNRKSEITITAPNDEVKISEDKAESEEALNANEIDIEIPKEKTTTIECKMVDDLPVVNHQLVEEPKKRETSSDHQQMKHPEPEIIEKGDETSEGTITQNNEILEMSAKSDTHIQNDANEHVQLEGLSSTISSNLERAVSLEYLEKKNNEAEEEAFRDQMIASLREVTANEQFQEEENDSNKQKEPETNWKSEINITVPNDEVEISEDKPESEEALNANELDIEIPKEKTSTECPTEVEKLVCSNGYPASVPGVYVNSEEIPDGVPCVISVIKSSEKDKIDDKDVKNLAEVSISQSHEKEDRKDISSVEVTESKESTQKMPSMLEPELCQLEEEREMEQLEEEASYGVECDVLPDEKTQQIDHHDLPVSQLLMEHILREEVLHPACNVEAEDDNHEGTDGVKQHDAGVPKGARNVSPKEFQNTSENVESQDKIQEKNDDGVENGSRIQQEEILNTLTPEQTASTTENKVGQENESSSPMVEEKKTSDAYEKLEIPAVKDGEETYNNLQDSSFIMAVAEDVKDEIPKMSEESIPAKDTKDEMPSMSEESTPVLVNDSRETTIKDEEETHSNIQDSSSIMTVAEDKKDEIPRMSEESTFIPSMSEEPTRVLVNDSRKPTIKDDEETHSNLQDSSPIMAVVEDVKDEIPRRLEESTPTEDVKDEIPSTSEESSPVLINDSKEPTVKDYEETHSNLQDSSPIMEVAEDVKDEIPMSEESTHILVNDSRESTSTEERSIETKTGIEECMGLTLVQDDKVQGSILEMCAVEQEINRSIESLHKDNLSSVAKTYAEDDLLEEGKVIPQDVEKSDEASYAVMEGHYHSNAESVAEKKNLVHKEETLPDHTYEQMSQSSNLQDDLLGQTLEIDPKVKKIEIEDKDSDDFTEIQAQREKNKSGEITYLSGPEEVEQSNFAVKSKDEILEVTENLLEDRSLSSDEKENVETKETQVYKDEFEAEKEHKAEESVQYERIVGEARDAEMKPAHKKSHNILSGVGSKVKHSLAKVKKAITGKSYYSKATPAN